MRVPLPLQAYKQGSLNIGVRLAFTSTLILSGQHEPEVGLTELNPIWGLPSCLFNFVMGFQA